MSALTSTASAQDIQRYFFSGPEPEADRKPLLATSGLLVTRERFSDLIPCTLLELALRLGLATFAHMDFEAFTGKLLVRTFVTANPAV